MYFAQPPALRSTLKLQNREENNVFVATGLLSGAIMQHFLIFHRELPIYLKKAQCDQSIFKSNKTI